MLADRICVREDAFRQAIAEDDMPLRNRLALHLPNGLIGFVEKPPANQRQPDGSEVSGRHDAPSRPWGALVSTLRDGVNAHSGVGVSFDWPGADRSGRDDVRLGLQPLEEAVEEPLADSLLPIRADRKSV